jgi:DNA-binding NtrC family response regulator
MDAMTHEKPAFCLYVSRAPDAELMALLESRDWTAAAADTLKDAQRMLDKEPVTLAIFDFASGYSAQQIARLEPVFAASGVGWVAAVSVEQLEQPQIRRLIRLYFFGFVTVPCNAQRMLDSLDYAYGMIQLDSVESEPDHLDNTEMIGSCDAMRMLLRSIDKVANTDAPVLICGESGTGKELTAAAIHKRSIRRKGPFVAINCGAIPRELLQAELFGYERGAFTGADQRKIGHVESAHGGTLFLDEIGDLPVESQVGLLRFLQERKIQRLGSHETIPVDVRVISATHVELEEAMEAGTFRTDLYHRLCVLRLIEPPLRERGRDIETLAYHMLERFRADSPRRIRGFSESALKAIYSYHWPGNVRELINRVRRAIVMTEGRVISPADLELEEHAERPVATLVDVREEAERRAICDALLRHRNRLTLVARDLGISRATLYRLMQNHGIRVRQAEPDHASAESVDKAAVDERASEPVEETFGGLLSAVAEERGAASLPDA